MTKNKGIEILRAMACCMILLHHISSTFEMNFVNSLGRYAVTIFICISGFLAGAKYEISNKPSIKMSIRHCIKKMKKLYWIYFIMFCIGLINIGLNIYKGQYNECIQLLPIKIITFLLMLQVWIPMKEFYYAINPSCWYLSMVMFLYFVQPYICYYLSKFRKKKIFIGIMCFIILIVLTIVLRKESFGGYIMYFFPLTRMFEFIIAVVVGMEWKEINLKCGMKIYTTLEIISIGLMILNIKTSLPIIWQYNVLFIPSSLFIIYIFARQKGFVFRILSNRIIIGIATISSVVYISHQLILLDIHIINKYVFNFSNKVIALLSIPVVFLISLLFITIHRNIIKRRLK